MAKIVTLKFTHGENILKIKISSPGLVKFIPEDQMQNRLAILLCNLKPSKMRGINSEAMVMCASTPEKVSALRSTLKTSSHLFFMKKLLRANPPISKGRKIFPHFISTCFNPELCPLLCFCNSSILLTVL
jgi:tRNA-binding EMAP/Myf-like protein